MSFAALNHPSLVAVLGAGAYAVLPSVEKAFVDGTLSLTGVKVANVVAYFCSVVATALPGRIDGADQRIGKDEDNEMIKLSTGKKGRTLVAPSGWYAMMNARLLLLLYTPPSLLIISVLSLTC
jgi:hypothetical protein